MSRFWNFATPKKSEKKRRSSMPAVHFVNYGSLDSEGESVTGSLHSDSSDQHLSDMVRLKRHSVCGPCPFGVPVMDHLEEEMQCLKNLDKLGLALENTFKEVETIDAYVNKLRTDFDREVVTEHRFMSCICSAKIARAACCRRQIDAWRQLQQSLLEFCCQQQQQQEELSGHDEDLDTHKCNGETSSTTSHETDIEALVGQLSKLSTFDRVKKRLDPEGDARAFIEHWIMQNYHQDHSSHH